MNIANRIDRAQDPRKWNALSIIAQLDFENEIEMEVRQSTSSGSSDLDVPARTTKVIVRIMGRD
jgi:hypothetical protein